jgi:nucleoside-diphosphate-sugar epimerase
MSQIPKVSSEDIASFNNRILVTGASGFIGSKVVETLLAYGFTNVRCFVRPSSRLDRLNRVLDEYSASEKVELISGDLLSRDDCREAAEEVAVIYHLAAGFDKSFAGAFMNSALATRNLMDAFLYQGRPKRFVNVSSFAVYSNLKLKRGALLDETCSLEDAPQERYDAYGFGKLKQEELVKEYGQRYGMPYVILRPGVVFGPGKRDLSGRIGNGAFGIFLHVGGSNVLPLTYVDNCAEAIVLGGLKPGVDGEIFNVVDDELLTSAQFLKEYKMCVGRFHSVRIPYLVAYGLSVLWEKYSCFSKGQLPPVFNRRRCAAEWKGNCYSNQKLREGLGWKPRVSLDIALASFLAEFQSGKE